MSENTYDKARQALKERGRHRGDLVDPQTGRVCLIGALYAAEGVEVHNKLGYRVPQNGLLAHAIREQFPDRVSPMFSDESHPEHAAVTVYEFNDSSHTTDADVDLVLDKTARLYDERV